MCGIVCFQQFVVYGVCDEKKNSKPRSRSRIPLPRGGRGVRFIQEWFGRWTPRPRLLNSLLQDWWPWPGVRSGKQGQETSVSTHNRALRRGPTSSGYVLSFWRRAACSTAPSSFARGCGEPPQCNGVINVMSTANFSSTPHCWKQSIPHIIHDNHTTEVHRNYSLSPACRWSPHALRVPFRRHHDCRANPTVTTPLPWPSQTPSLLRPTSREWQLIPRTCTGLFRPATTHLGCQNHQVGSVVGTNHFWVDSGFFCAWPLSGRHHHALQHRVAADRLRARHRLASYLLQVGLLPAKANHPQPLHVFAHPRSAHPSPCPSLACCCGLVLLPPSISWQPHSPNRSHAGPNLPPALELYDDGHMCQVDGHIGSSAQTGKESVGDDARGSRGRGVGGGGGKS